MDLVTSPSPLDIVTRDGIRLSGQYWTPSADTSSSLPLVLCRTAQPLSHLEAFARALVQQGYPVVLQSVRGRGSSRGRFRPYFQELEDGEDTVLALQRKNLLSSRTMLPVGLGYDGQSALSLSLSAPCECLCALAASAPSASHFHSGLCTNGLPTGISLYRLARWLPKYAYLSRAAFSAWLAQPRWGSGLSPFSASPALEEWVLELRTSPTFNSFWKHPTLCPRSFLRNLPDLPTFLATGTAATTCAGTMSLAQQISARNSEPLELWLGDWDDDALEDYTPTAPVAQRLIDWLQRFSQKNGTNALGGRNIHYLIQKGDHQPHWQELGNWPSLDQVPQKFYLTPGALSPTPPDITATSDYFDNPLESPTSSKAWSFTSCEPRFGEFRLPLATRGDVLAFTSPPFSATTTLLGTPHLRLRVSSNRSDTQFLARLVLVPPVGHAYVVAFGAARLALRYGFENLVAFSPGADAPATLNFALQPLACELPPGSRLRLEVCTNDFPRFPLATNALPKNDIIAYPRSVRNAIEFDPRGTNRLTLPVFNKAPPTTNKPVAPSLQ